MRKYDASFSNRIENIYSNVFFFTLSYLPYFVRSVKPLNYFLSYFLMIFLKLVNLFLAFKPWDKIFHQGPKRVVLL